MTSAQYCRVYWAVVDDPKFASVYDDDRALATWLRLLIVADQAHPASAHIPSGTHRATVLRLEEVGLIDLGTGSRYRIHGLDAERAQRSESGRNAAAMRWHSKGNAEPMPSRAEQSRAEQSTTRDGLPNLDPAALGALEERTGHVASQAGDKQLNEYDRLVGDHGLAPVLAAFDAVRNGKRMTARQLVWGAVKVLEPFPSKPAPAAPEDKPFTPRKLEPWEQELRSAIAAKNGGFDEGDAA